MSHWPSGDKQHAPIHSLSPEMIQSLPSSGYIILWTHITYQLPSYMWCYHLLYRSQPTRHLNGQCITAWSACTCNLLLGPEWMYWNSNVYLNAQTLKGKVNLRKWWFVTNVHPHVQTCKPSQRLNIVVDFITATEYMQSWLQTVPTMVAVQFSYWRWECKIIWTAYDDLAFSIVNVQSWYQCACILVALPHTHTQPYYCNRGLFHLTQLCSKRWVGVFWKFTAHPLEWMLSHRSQGTLFTQALAFSRPSLATIVVNPSGVMKQTNKQTHTHMHTHNTYLPLSPLSTQSLHLRLVLSLPLDLSLPPLLLRLPLESSC